MINERESRILEALERQTSAEDPAFAEWLAGVDPWARWRSAWRAAMAVPVLLLVAVLSVTAFALNVSSLGVSFLIWALVGAATWRARSRHGARLLTRGQTDGL
jgi:Protein of unknown function (DUF3040)